MVDRKLNDWLPGKFKMFSLNKLLHGWLLPTWGSPPCRLALVSDRAGSRRSLRSSACLQEETQTGPAQQIWLLQRYSQSHRTEQSLEGILYGGFLWYFRNYTRQTSGTAGNRETGNFVNSGVRHWRIQGDGGARNTRLSPPGPSSFIFMQFSAKKQK